MGIILKGEFVLHDFGYAWHVNRNDNLNNNNVTNTDNGIRPDSFYN